MRLEGLVPKPMSFFTFFSFFFFNYNVYMFALGSQEYFRGFFCALVIADMCLNLKCLRKMLTYSQESL